MTCGYAGMMLDIDLSARTITRVPLEREMREKYLGGTGFNTYILYNEISPGAEPLGPENILVFSTGVFSGTNIPTSCRTEASAISPATGLLGTSSSGNYWGGELKFAGFDGIIIRGTSEQPVYVWIHDGEVEILPAGDTWGRDAWETIHVLRQEHGDEEIQVACIGQAGEKMVRFASIENGPYDAWGRTGLGAVMGSKKLKAIAVRGTGPVRVARKKEFLAAVKTTRESISSSPFYEPFRKYGTMLTTLPYQEFGVLPGRNYQAGTVEGWVETRSRKQLHKYSNRGVSCMACPIACAHWVEVEEGPYAGLKMKDMEVTPVIGFGAGCDIDNLPAIAQLSAACQRYGMDMVTAAAAAAFAMELYQDGIIKSADLGFELPWGNEEAIFRLLDCIARREGLGDILAEGTMRAARRLGGYENYTAHVKGLECFLIDPRARWSTWTLGYVTNTRGGDHLRTRNPVENLRYNENPSPYRTEKFAFPPAMLENLDMPEDLKADIFDPSTRDVNIPRMSKWSEDLITVYNATGLCIRPPVLHTVGPTLVAQLYSSLTGCDTGAGDIIKAGERIWNLQKLFNIRRGERPEDSDFPARFYKTPSSAGKTLDREKVRETLREYYHARGWDPGTGHPSPEKLEELHIKK